MTTLRPPGRAALPGRLMLAVALMGLTGLLAQVILTRELLCQFFGNELSIALVLTVWLVMVAAGSAAAARLLAGLPSSERAFAWSQILMAALLPPALLLARRAQPGELTPGQVLGPAAMLLASLQALSLVCLTTGFQFVLAARAAVVRSVRRGDAAVSPVARVYAVEACGAVIGGFLFHFWLAEHVLPFRTLAAAGLLNIASAWALLRPRLSLAEAPRLVPGLLLGAALLALFALGDQVEIAALQSSPRWADLKLLAHVPSRYGALTVAEREGQFSFSQSGVLVFTSEDDYANEVSAHLPLLEHPRPARALVIGGALAGLPEEALKHPLERLDCVELDPRLVDLARRWLPPGRRGPSADPRFRLHLGDARLFVRHARAVYDVIIINLPDPTTAALNRFYTVEWFREVRRALAPGGLLSFRLTGSEMHLSGPVLLAAATARHTVGQVFPHHLVVPGERMFFLAAKRPGALSPDWEPLAERLRERGIETHFVNEAWLRDALLPFRMQRIREAILGQPQPRVNTDLNPVSYYHQTRIWLDQLSPGLAKPARLLSRVRIWWAALPLPLAALLAALTRGRGRRFAALAILVATAAIGAFGLLVEVLGLLAFQSACGYLYHALGALIAAFMAGLALGAAVVSARTATQLAFGRLLVAGLVTGAAASLLLPGLLRFLLPSPALASVVLTLLLFLVGSVVGGLFPVAAALYRRQREAAAAGGMIYAADLAGSAGAAFVTGAVALPLLGVSGVCLTAALLLGAALVLALPLLRTAPAR